MSDMSNKNASTIVFPLPMDIMEAFKTMAGFNTPKPDPRPPEEI